MTLQKHILFRLKVFSIVLLIFASGFYLKFLVSNDGIEILYFIIFGSVWLVMSALYLLIESFELKESKRKFNLITGISILVILTILVIQFMIGAAKVF